MTFAPPQEPSIDLPERHDHCHVYLVATGRYETMNVYTNRTNNPTGTPAPDGQPRLNLLLTYGGWRERPAVEQLPQLLRPMGIQAMQAESGEEAAKLISSRPIHIAVVDLEIPVRSTNDRSPQRTTVSEGGLRILKLLRRLDPAPPTIVVRPPQPTEREHVRGLSHSLRDGAFAVLDRPMHIEALLEVLRRVLKRHYENLWPEQEEATGRPMQGRPIRRNEQ